MLMSRNHIQSDTGQFELEDVNMVDILYVGGGVEEWKMRCSPIGDVQKSDTTSRMTL
jgi:hypothetical protein